MTKDKIIAILKYRITMVDPNDMGETYPYISADDEDLEEIADLLEIAPEMLEALETVYSLINDGDLVRDISRDNDFMYFTNQAIRINNAIVSINEAIKKAKS